jgi:subtilisin family serine protease
MFGALDRLGHRRGIFLNMHTFSGFTPARAPAAFWTALATAFVFLLAAVASPASASTDTDPYIVVLKDSVEHPGNVAHRHEENRDAELGHIYEDAIKGYSAELSDRELKAVRRDPAVAYVERDIVLQATSQTVPNGVKRVFGASNPTLDIDGNDDVQVNADVAVIDTGVNAHPDLRVVARTDCTVATNENRWCQDDVGQDESGHGTHVAGTVGALDNSYGVIGVAPGARIWSVKSGNANSEFPLSDVIAGVNWVTARAGQIEVANMSLSCMIEEDDCGRNKEALKAAITKSVDAGVVYVVSASNKNLDVSGVSNAGDDSLEYSATIPASYANVITVSSLADFDGVAGGMESTSPCSYEHSRIRMHGVNAPEYVDADDSLANFSNWGDPVDIAAPGTCILSTASNGGYEVKSGTSMATPHVTGAAAILASMSNPNSAADVTAIRAALRANGNSSWTDTHHVVNDSNTAYVWVPDNAKEPLLDIHDPLAFSVRHPGNVTGISATSNTDGALQLFARNEGGRIWSKDYNPFANPVGWQNWGTTALPVNETVPIVDSPAVISRASHSRDLFVRGADNQLYFRNWDSYAGTWSQWFWIPGPNGSTISSSPAAVANPGIKDALTVVVRGSNNQLYLKNYDPAYGWSGWVALGNPPGGATSSPAVAIHDYGTHHVSVRGGNGQIWDRAWNAATGWSEWISLGGSTITSPAMVTTNNEKDLWVFIRGTANDVQFRRYSAAAGAWGSWTSLGGAWIGYPAATTRDDAGVDVFAIGWDGKVQNRRYVYGTWTKWMRIDDGCPPGAC